jgi:pescadillo protein
MRKVKKALVRGEKLKAKQLKASAPNYSLDHLVKERYPTFSDAINDLDDALSLISLFGSFPTHKDLKIPHSLISNCSDLMKQFKVYVINSHSLRKVKIIILYY